MAHQASRSPDLFPADISSSDSLGNAQIEAQFRLYSPYQNTLPQHSAFAADSFALDYPATDSAMQNFLQPHLESDVRHSPTASFFDSQPQKKRKGPAASPSLSTSATTQKPPLPPSPTFHIPSLLSTPLPTATTFTRPLTTPNLTPLLLTQDNQSPFIAISPSTSATQHHRIRYARRTTSTPSLSKLSIVPGSEIARAVPDGAVVARSSGSTPPVSVARSSSCVPSPAVPSGGTTATNASSTAARNAAAAEASTARFWAQRGDVLKRRGSLSSSLSDFGCGVFAPPQQLHSAATFEAYIPLTKAHTTPGAFVTSLVASPTEASPVLFSSSAPSARTSAADAAARPVQPLTSLGDVLKAAIDKSSQDQQHQQQHGMVSPRIDGFTPFESPIAPSPAGLGIMDHSSSSWSHYSSHQHGQDSMMLMHGGGGGSVPAGGGVLSGMVPYHHDTAFSEVELTGMAALANEMYAQFPMHAMEQQSHHQQEQPLQQHEYASQQGLTPLLGNLSMYPTPARDAGYVEGSGVAPTGESGSVGYPMGIVEEYPSYQQDYGMYQQQQPQEMLWTMDQIQAMTSSADDFMQFMCEP
ncbi:hypothetical protein HDU98_009780 [Podochytrium sp. JEL0797]|nr:hypothetical protein HDU98_009780 [Podochytrium sp. JEL0797]